MRNLITTLGELTGAASTVVGVAHWSHGAAYVVGGVWAVLFSVKAAR